jgi:protein tyrosine phosphatase (PTP) superfamily phosphohydrolase (DUF442 family)
MHRTLAFTAAALFALAGLAACASEPPAPIEVPKVVERDDHGEIKGIHNYIVWTPRVTTGAQPEGEIAFRNLAALGVKTIVSVDGAKPDVALAEKYGMKYVHIPIGYDGIHDRERQQIVKAAAVNEGPIFFHCHHGKHRGPAGAAVACIGDEGLTPDQAIEFMKKAGTDPKYAGLYKAAKDSKPVDLATARALPVELVSAVEPEGIVDAMVHIDERNEFLKKSKARGWTALPDAPDIAPAHEAKMLWEGYREIARLEEATAHGGKFMKYNADAEAAALALEEALRAGDNAAADKAFEASQKSCKSCHADFRDK